MNGRQKRKKASKTPVLGVCLDEADMDRVVRFQERQGFGLSLSAAGRQLILKALDAVEKEAAR